jgi:hypothetical protein
MADRVHPTPHQPPPPSQQARPPTETTSHHPPFHRPPTPPPGTYIVHVPKDQVLCVPPPDRERRYSNLAARPATRRCRCLRRACCRSCSALLLLVLLAAAFAGAVYLVFRPRAPSFSVASLSVRSLDAAALRLGPLLSLAIDASVRADNGRNKKVGVDYRGGGTLAVAYSGARLAAGPWPAFCQAPRNVTVFSASLTGGDGVALTAEQRRRLAADQAAGAVPLTVEARVPVRLRFGKVLRTWTVDVKAACGVVVDRLAAGTPAAVTNRGCRVRIKPLWWWW